jgi:hypothetical protein
VAERARRKVGLVSRMCIFFIPLIVVFEILKRFNSGKEIEQKEDLLCRPTVHLSPRIGLTEH